MKWIFSFLLIINWCILGAQTAQTNDNLAPAQLLEQANNLYQQGKFADALKTYKAVEATGKTSSYLHQNLGNTYFRLDSIGKAILHYEKAIKINPSNTQAQQSLAFANDFVSQKVGVWPDIFYKKWLRNIVGIAPAWLWWFLAVALAWLMLFCAKKYLYAPNVKTQKTNFYSAVASLVFSLFFLIFGIARHQWQTNDTYAIVTTPLLAIKNGPSQNSKDIVSISQGNKLQILDSTSEGWCKIQLPDGQQGWIHSQDLARIF